MIEGAILNRRASLTLFVRGVGGQGDLEFTVDTGFTGALTLPPAVCVALRLPMQRSLSAFLADNSQTLLDVYLITAVLEGVEQEYEVLAIESDPLIGMTFLDGYEVCLQVTENGSVRLRAL